jgi:predicted 2-oxoglutarate/Fe(II)-dependent dioxygenase YbiX
MNGEWCYFKSRFNSDQCDYILQEGLKIPAHSASLGVDGENLDNNFRRSQVRFIQQTDQKFKFLFDEIWKMGIEANAEWFNFHITKLSFIQLAEYSEQYKGEYKRHHDVFWMNGDPFYHRKLTCVIQLSHPLTYEGGDFKLYDLSCGYPDKNEIRTRGTAIFIPSFTPHAALPVTKGVRYSLAVWFDGPKWR